MTYCQKSVCNHVRKPLPNDVINTLEHKILGSLQTLYRIEEQIRWQTQDERHAVRQEMSKPVIEAFELRLTESSARISAKSPTGKALKYIAKYWDGLTLFLSDGRIELDNNTVIRPIALNRKNALFAGHDAGTQNWAVIASLIETCKLSNIEPHGYWFCILTAIATDYKQADIKELLPWNYERYVG